MTDPQQARAESGDKLLGFAKLPNQPLWNAPSQASRQLVTQMLKRQDKEFNQVIMSRTLK
jgi:hypothetical protein